MGTSGTTLFQPTGLIKSRPSRLHVFSIVSREIHERPQNLNLYITFFRSHEFFGKYNIPDLTLPQNIRGALYHPPPPLSWVTKISHSRDLSHSHRHLSNLFETLSSERWEKLVTKESMTRYQDQTILWTRVNDLLQC